MLDIVYPLVSIIVPAYNCENTIDETLNALINQKYANYEIIIVDDGSTDNTKTKLSKYENQIRVITQENAGVAAARNTGIHAARGDWVGFCDADDIWSEHKLSAQVNCVLTKPEIEMIFCGWWVWSPDEKGVFEVPEDFNTLVCDQYTIDDERSGWIYHQLLLDCLCLTSTVLIRKSLIDKVGFFDESLKCGEDYDYWLRISRITKTVKLKSKYVLYRQHQQSITRKPHEINYEYKVLENAIQRWGLKNENGQRVDRIKIKRRLAKLNFDFAYNHYKSGNYSVAIKSLMRAIIHEPSWYLPWGYLFVSLSKLVFK